MIYLQLIIAIFSALPKLFNWTALDGGVHSVFKSESELMISISTSACSAVYRFPPTCGVDALHLSFSSKSQTVRKVTSDHFSAA